jgi:hypothetical protein
VIVTDKTLQREDVAGFPSAGVLLETADTVEDA